MKQLPQYTLTKTVRAAQIVSMSQDAAGYNINLGEDYGVRSVPHTWPGNGSAEPGGYFIEYDNGYQTYAAREKFEQGYMLISSVAQTDIQAATEAATAGGKRTRK